MATKKQKREAGEAKAKRETEERRQSGLAAQRADQARRSSLEKRYDQTTQTINQRHRSTLLKNGINPSTGLVFDDYDMAEMERKATTPERRHLFEQIRAGRAGLLNEQPPLGGIDGDLDSAKNPYETIIKRRLQDAREEDPSAIKRMDAIERMAYVAKKNGAPAIPLHTNNQLYAMERKKDAESQDYDPFGGMTVGEFRDTMDKMWTDWTERQKNEKAEDFMREGSTSRTKDL